MHLYVHVPFCERRCSYCDFAIAVRRGAPDADFLTAIEQEWRWHLAREVSLPPGDCPTVYLGGGTPSRLRPATVGRLLERVAADRGIAVGAEVTLEANPEDVTAAAAAGWRAAGVNRISLGIQSFDDRTLAWMHRSHDAASGRRAATALRKAGFENVSIDLIYGLPAVLSRDWVADLDAALELEPTHLSLYALTAEPRTPLARWIDRGETVVADDGQAAKEYAHAHTRLAAAGWRHYEVSNAALPGFESRHNRAYWFRAPYLGLGPSAHSEVGGERWWNIRHWEGWRRALAAGGSPIEGGERLADEQLALERRYLGLRTDHGVPASSLPENEVETWLSAGWARRDGSRVVLSAEGWLRLDGLVTRVE